jgi:hypothetical protein
MIVSNSAAIDRPPAPLFVAGSFYAARAALTTTPRMRGLC